MPKSVELFNENCRSFKLFKEAIKRQSTLRAYTYALNEFVRFTELSGFDELASLDTDNLESSKSI